MSALPVMIDLVAIADILAEMANDLEHLGAALCRNPAVVTDHIIGLQMIDAIAQKQHALANVLRADCHKTAWSSLNLDELKLRIDLDSLAGSEKYN
jgi:hypothetical protein